MSVRVIMGDGHKSYTTYHHLGISNTCFTGIHSHRSSKDCTPVIDINENTLFWFLEPDKKSVSVLLYGEGPNRPRIYKYYSDKFYYETLNSGKEI